MRQTLTLAVTAVATGVMLAAWVMRASADMRSSNVCNVSPNEAVVIA